MMTRPVTNTTIQARVDAFVNSGERRGRVIADALGIRSEYARACVQRALRFAATGRRTSAAEARRRVELKRAARGRA